ncbi:glycoside hydrolase family 26 protein [Flavobacterium restrictum]|uniref:Mannan endo-1,4-beta-mannosidase n=1 Tax=Flavobacterium restrictum TaxID=2594428 RepID=A0A553E892_9FLAO|nr:glycosyl hydrolase [Flavobacterium restrictum]TRX41288.1 beta-mannosidase [Flavobacterium restrictum]
MKKTIAVLLTSFVLGSSFSLTAQRVDTKLTLSDKKATSETKILYQNLNKLTQKGFLFGHQDDLAYGVNWKYEDGRSDVKDVVGDFPALYGWDLGGIENDSKTNLDGVPFDKIRQYIIAVQKRGGINTISWHLNNPMTGKTAWDNSTKSLASILPGGENHATFKTWLDKEAAFLLSLKDAKGKAIPVLYRPFHELTGGWFWWGKENCTSEEFKTLWKFSFAYLQKKGVHNLIYVYNTGGFKTREVFLENYPGTEFADVLSFDNYQYNDPTKSTSFIDECQSQFKIIDEIAHEQHKLIAFAEAGYEGIPYAQWWTDTLLKAIGDYKISYVLLWRNFGWQEKEQKMHYYAPYTGQISEKDFVNFYQLPKTLFEKEAAKAHLYKKN